MSAVVLSVRRSSVFVAALLAIQAIAGSSVVAQDHWNRTRDGVTAGATFLMQERDLWRLENRLLRDAMGAIKSADQDARPNEGQYRKLIRANRNRETLNLVRFFLEDYIDRETLAMLNDIGREVNLTAEEVFADYLTCEATLDFSLMASAYNTYRGNNYDKFPPEAQKLLKNLTAHLRSPPVPSDEIKAELVERDNVLNVTVFGCEINEKIVDSRERGDKATVTWRSNYTFLRDIKERRAPQDTRDETMTLERNRWRTSYAAELRDFTKTAGRENWGTKVRELLDIDGFISRKDPLDDRRNRRAEYNYDPEEGVETNRVTGRDRRSFDENDRDRERR
jgi:hypothetical protein